MIVRIIAVMVLLFSVLTLPWWVSIILALLGMIYFSFFVEAVILFFISDLLYGVPQMRFLNVVFISSILSLICFIILELLKKKLRFYPK